MSDDTPTPPDVPPPAYDVFLGYAGPDRDLAERLAGLLHGRVAMWWDHFLLPDESFDIAIPRILSSSRVFALIVNPRTWGTQYYASDELNRAVQLARDGKMRIVPIWVEEFPAETKPSGLYSQKGLSLAGEQGCVGCIASKLVAVVLRARLEDAERRVIQLTNQNLPPIMLDGGLIEPPPDARLQRLRDADLGEPRRNSEFDPPAGSDSERGHLADPAWPPSERRVD